ncbi:MAG: hypothetical protein RMI32_07295 [Candidatus Nitrosocaldus sp.]|nr:hypothetical protein [Candidatus Nitrosocaldus sp.]
MEDAPSMIATVMKKEVLGDALAPVEFHIASRRLFDDWYKRFIDVYEIY